MSFTGVTREEAERVVKEIGNSELVAFAIKNSPSLLDKIKVINPSLAEKFRTFATKDHD